MDDNLIIISNKNSKAVFKGPKLVTLVLDSVEVIPEDLTSEHFLHSGCYLMFPWVGRLKTDTVLKEIAQCEELLVPFHDSANLPIHGLYANTEREIVERKEDCVTFAPVQSTVNKGFPHFQEKFLIGDTFLEITTSFSNNSDKEQYFAYGYHPYISISKKKINELYLESNVENHCIFTSQLIPSLNNDNTLKMEEYILNAHIGDKSLDDLFVMKRLSDKNPYVSLIDKQFNKKVTVQSEKNSGIVLNYFQIYTPLHRESIAIEPMSSPSDAMNINFPEHLKTLMPQENIEGKIRISIELFSSEGD